MTVTVDIRHQTPMGWEGCEYFLHKIFWGFNALFILLTKVFFFNFMIKNIKQFLHTICIRRENACFNKPRQPQHSKGSDVEYLYRAGERKGFPGSFRNTVSLMLTSSTWSHLSHWRPWDTNLKKRMEKSETNDLGGNERDIYQKILTIANTDI